MICQSQLLTRLTSASRCLTSSYPCLFHDTRPCCVATNCKINEYIWFIAPPGAQEVAMSVCDFYEFFTQSACILSAFSQKSLRNLSEVSQQSLRSISAVSQQSLRILSAVSQMSFSSLLTVSQQSLDSFLAVFWLSLSSLIALSPRSLAISFLIHLNIPRAYFIKPAEHVLNTNTLSC